MSIHLFKERVPSIGIYAPTKRYNEVWTLVSWDPFGKKYVPDNSPQGTLRLMGLTDHIDPAPPMYRGRLPSPEAIRFCAQNQRAHDEWVERRADMLEGNT